MKFKTWIENEKEAIMRCDDCDVDTGTNAVRTAKAAAQKHHRATGHEVRVEVAQTLWIPGVPGKSRSADK